MKPIGRNLLNFSLDVGGTTHPGKIRKNNEDSFVMMTENGCFVVSDGMGGGSAGEIASRMVVDSVQKKLQTSGRSPAARERAVIQAAYSCNTAINNYCIEHNYESMGATMACLLLDSWDPNFATVFHAGDSRVYRWRGHELEKLTRDHSLAEAENMNEEDLPKEQQGIPAEECTEHPQKDTHEKDLFDTVIFFSAVILGNKTQCRLMECPGAGVNHVFNRCTGGRSGNGEGPETVDGGLHCNVGYGKCRTLNTCRNTDFKDFAALFPINFQLIPCQPVTCPGGGKHPQDQSGRQSVTDKGG